MIKLRFVCVLIALCFTSVLVSRSAAQTWNQLAPTGGPPSARSISAGAYDAATNQMIVFGGSAFSVNHNDSWTLSLGGSPQWNQLSPAGSLPAPRVRHRIAYDAANSRMMLFGGGLGATSPCANDIWVLANANSLGGIPAWTQLSPAGAAPAPRNVHSAVYDPASNRMTIFAGNNCFSGFFNDVWVLSNANGLGGTPAWTQLTPAGIPPAPTGYHSAVYDPATNRMIVFGVINPSVSNNQVWVLTNANGLGGTPTWIHIVPDGTVGIRNSHTAVYDEVSNRMIVFGGGDTIDVNGTWVLSNANGLGGTSSWTQLSPSGTLPPAREEHTAVYDPIANRMIVFAGGGSVGRSPVYFNDVWILANANGLGTDTTPPVITPQIVGTSGNGGWYTSDVTVAWSVTDAESGVASSTGCSTTTLSANSAGVTLTCSATNGAGLSSSVSTTVKIDKTGPVISGLPGQSCSLWPPNNKLVQVATVSSTDALSGLSSFSVTGVSNEPSGPNDPDIVISGTGTQPRVVQLRADRLGTGTGRVYTITATSTDIAGNSNTSIATCVVPHDQGH